MPESKALHHFYGALRSGLLLGLAYSALGAQAQGPSDNPDWQETEVPVPPSFDARQLVCQG